MIQSAVNSSKMSIRWTIRELLYFVTLVSMFIAVCSFIGFQNPFIWYCLICSTVLVLVFFMELPTGRTSASMTTTLGIGLFSFGCFFIVSIVMIVNCMFHFVWILIARRTQPVAARTALFVSLTLTLLSFFIGLTFGFSDYMELVESRKQFQPTRLESRLAYEKRSSIKQADSSKHIEKWSEFESVYAAYHNDSRYYSSRRSSLKRLHNRSVESFVKSMGFGVGRMMMPYWFDLNPDPLILDNLPIRSFSNELIERQEILLPPVWVQPAQEFNKDMRGFHFANKAEFLLPEANGVELREGEWIGFTPHAFHWPRGFVELDEESLGSLVQLQLISLIKYDPPQAYVLDHLPRMDHLSKAGVKTRDLNDFELSALEELKDGEILVADVSADQVQALGAIVTVDSCQECHATQRGHLLGAFSYRFQKINKPFEFGIDDKRDLKFQQQPEIDIDQIPELIDD